MIDTYGVLRCDGCSMPATITFQIGDEPPFRACMAHSDDMRVWLRRQYERTTAWEAPWVEITGYVR